MRSVSGFCIMLKGFLSPPGLQLTPRLTGMCPFSISASAKAENTSVVQQKNQKLPAGGKQLSVSCVKSFPSDRTESFVQLENGRFSPDWCPMRLGREEKLKGWTEEGADQLCRTFSSCHGSSSAVIPPKCLPGEASPHFLPW